MKKNIRNIIAITVIAVLALGGLRVARYLDTDDTRSYTRIMMHQLYEPDENIEILFVGASNTYRGLVPEVADEIFGQYTFNGGSSSQRKDGSYAVIKEAVANNDISQIYLDMTYNKNWEDSYQDRTEMTSTYIISDYIKNPFRRASYLLRASSSKYYVDGFCVARRNWKNLLDPSQIKKIWSKKQRESYKNYEYVKSDGAEEYYVDRGFVATIGELTGEEVVYSSQINEIESENVSQDWLDSVYAIVDLCKAKGIELIFYTVPRQESLFLEGNYDDYVDYMRQLADQLEVKFYDFELCKSEYFDTSDWTYFKSSYHLNTAGAEKFTELFSRFFVGEITEEDLFYSSFEEKVAAEPVRINGVLAQEDKENSEMNQIHIAVNREAGLEYKIVFRQDNGEVYEVQDFSENRGFTLPKNVSGVIEIEWREQGASGESQIEEYSYVGS